MNQNMFSLIKQIEYWLPMFRKALSNKIQVTKKKKRKYKSLRESKKRTPGWLPLPSQTTQGFTSSFKKKGKKALNRMSSLFFYCLSPFLHFFILTPDSKKKNKLHSFSSQMPRPEMAKTKHHSSLLS